MEIKAELLKPYTENERVNFILLQNRKNGYTIEETETSLEAWGYAEEEIAQQERERLDNLKLTSADVERAIYEAKGMDFTDLVNFVIAQEIEDLDIKRLKIELKANHFVRKHPYINMIGQLLGYTSDDMDYLFEHKTFPPVEDIPEEITEEEMEEMPEDIPEEITKDIPEDIPEEITKEMPEEITEEEMEEESNGDE